MSTKDFTTTIVVDQTPAEVFNAINNVREWWSGEITGDTNKLNDEFTYRYKEFHVSKQKIVEMVPGKKVVWLVTESSLNFVKNKSEWTGTKIIFEISAQGDKTKLHFTHQGLVPEVECFDSCKNGWTQLIQKSLLHLVSTGQSNKVAL